MRARAPHTGAGMYAGDGDASDPFETLVPRGRSLYTCCGACGGVLALAVATAFIVLVLNA